MTLAFPSLPDNPVKALEAVAWFCMGGKLPEGGGGGRNVAPCYDFKQDFGLIWGGFLGQFGIDLAKIRLHWWHFLTLVGCLGEDCKFSQVAAIRAVNLADIKDKKQRQRVAGIKKKFALKSDGRNSKVGEQRIVDSLEGLF